MLVRWPRASGRNVFFVIVCPTPDVPNPALLQSQIFILSLRGDAIITKDYRHDVPRASHDVFFRNYKFGEGRDEVAPVFHIDGVNYYHIKVR